MEPEPTPPDLSVPVFAFEAGLALVAVILGWIVGTNPFETFSWNAASLPTALGWTLPPLAAFLLTVRFPVGPFRSLTRMVREKLVPLFESSSTAGLALVAIGAGVGEEVLFRGLVQGWLQDVLGPWPALVVAALVFGAAHMVTRTYAAWATVMGAYLGWIWMDTGELLIPIAVHALYDFVALVVVVKLIPRTEDSTRSG